MHTEPAGSTVVRRLAVELAEQAASIDKLGELLDAVIGRSATSDLSDRLQMLDYVHQVLLDVSAILLTASGSLGSQEKALSDAVATARLADLRERLHHGIASAAVSGGDCDFF